VKFSNEIVFFGASIKVLSKKSPRAAQIKYEIVAD
jgi:hypothetical protein